MKLASVLRVTAIVVATLAINLIDAARDDDKPVGEPLVIEKSIELDPAKTYGRIVIKASNITIDGRGAMILGAKDGDPKSFKGTGISAAGVSGVTL